MDRQGKERVFCGVFAFVQRGSQEETTIAGRLVANGQRLLVEPSLSQTSPTFSSRGPFQLGAGHHQQSHGGGKTEELNG